MSHSIGPISQTPLKYIPKATNVSSIQRNIFSEIINLGNFPEFEVNPRL